MLAGTIPMWPRMAKHGVVVVFGGLRRRCITMKSLLFLRQIDVHIERITIVNSPLWWIQEEIANRPRKLISPLCWTQPLPTRHGVHPMPCPLWWFRREITHRPKKPISPLCWTDHCPHTPLHTEVPCPVWWFQGKIMHRPKRPISMLCWTQPATTHI